jgi:hypothetical protein
MMTAAEWNELDPVVKAELVVASGSESLSAVIQMPFALAEGSEKRTITIEEAMERAAPEPLREECYYG